MPEPPAATFSRAAAIARALPRRLATARRRRLAIQAAGLALLAALLAVRVADPRPVEAVRLQAFDAYQRLWPRRASAEPVLVVRIDEPSLAEIGQWPWPRTVVAELVDRLAGAGAAVVGLDILLAEPDRTSPPVVARQVPGLSEASRAALAALPDHDAALAAAIGRGPVVLGEASLAGPGADPGRPDPRPAALALVGPDPAPFLPRYPGRLRSLPALEAAASGVGNVDLAPEVDGRARRIPLLTLAGGRVVPALAVEVVRVALGGSTLVARTTAAGIDGVSVGGRAIRTDERGRVWVHFAARGGAARRTVSARAVLAGEVAPERIAGRIVLVGATAAGLGDLHPTPVGGMTPGVEIHAQLVETILARSGLIRPAYALGVELVLTLGGGLLMLALVPRLGAFATLVLGGAVTGSVVLGATALYVLGGVLIDPSFAAAAGLMLWGSSAYLRYLREERARRRAADRLAMLRQEGLLAAQTQRAILPRRLPAVPSLALHAEMHPAFDVGGDFYDAFELPAGRLGIAVGDVSGKGMAAALFMAVARTVLRSTATADAGPSLTRANDLLAADNEAAMFVTLFYGVLDPASGVLDYANGGHNPPLLLDAAGNVRTLEHTGGVALGAFEGLAYASRSLRLAPGDTLLLYTDGVTEAFAADGRTYGEDRLRDRVAAGGRGPSGLVERVVADVRAFAAGTEPSDDITCLAVAFVPVDRGWCA